MRRTLVLYIIIELSTALTIINVHFLQVYKITASSLLQKKLITPFYFIIKNFLLYKTALILYIVCFSLYVLFSRQPDYFDGEMNVAVIHFTKDSTGNQQQPYAVFQSGKKTYSVNAAYLFRSFTKGENVPIIYETSQPEKGAVYSLWGYWVTLGETLFSFVLLVLFYQIAVSITQNPSPESLIDQLEYKPTKKGKYEE